MSTDAGREALLELQAAALRSLYYQGETPAELDATSLVRLRRQLVRKRVREAAAIVRRLHPTLQGDELETDLQLWVEAHPPGANAGPSSDAAAFIQRMTR